MDYFILILHPAHGPNIPSETHENRRKTFVSNIFFFSSVYNLFKLLYQTLPSKFRFSVISVWSVATSWLTTIRVKHHSEEEKENYKFISLFYIRVVYIIWRLYWLLIFYACCLLLCCFIIWLIVLFFTSSSISIINFERKIETLKETPATCSFEFQLHFWMV